MGRAEHLEFKRKIVNDQFTSLSGETALLDYSDEKWIDVFLPTKNRNERQ